MQTRFLTFFSTHSRRVTSRLPTFALALAAACCFVSGCRTEQRPQVRKTYRRVRMLTTAYCPCQKCCGWTRNRHGTPVFASGHLKGKPKKIGVCADGTKAAIGTVAADTRHYPFGTRLYVPGYGFAEVHDRGSAIQGPQHIDLFFPRHRQALNWGRRVVTVRVYDVLR